jgi:N-acetylmuramic acid 6-phosphate etherase
LFNLENLITERRNPQTLGLDSMSLRESLQKMNAEDTKVALAVERALPEIERVIRQAIKSLKSGGRLIYMGSGTSGRLGVLDAAESVPTFGVSSDMVVGLIAGGNGAMLSAVEGAEDDENLGASDLKKISLTTRDLVIGIAASGRTPYVVGGLDYAGSLGGVTAAISCNPHALISQHADFPIEVDCGPEILAGSTRLKSGTAQKMILNMISTLSMVGIGKVYQNLMVDLRPTNEKLVERSKHIIMEATVCTYDVAEENFETSDKNVKTAIVMILAEVNKNEALTRLAKAEGFVKNAIKKEG